MDPVTLAAAAVALLAQKGGEAFATQAGTAAWSALTRLATFLRGHFRGDKAAEAIDSVAEGSTTDDALKALGSAITQAAQSDPKFAAELQELVQSAERAGVVNHGVYMEIKGNVEKQLTFNAEVIIEGDFNV